MIHLINTDQVISVVTKTGKFIALGAGKGVRFRVTVFYANYSLPTANLIFKINKY